VKRFLAVLSILVVAFATAASAQLATDIDGNQTKGEVKIGTNGQNYSDGRSSNVGFIDAFERVGNRTIVEEMIQGGQYFGSDFGGAGGSIIVSGRSLFYGDDLSGSYVQVGGFRNTHTDQTQAYNAFIEAGTLIYHAPIICGPNGKNIRDGFVKAVELDYNQTWQGFGIAPVNTDVHTFSPRLIVYLPKGFDFMLRGGVVDIIQNGLHNPTPTGGARLRVPVTKRLQFTASAGFDSEGLTNTAQLFQFSTRNYGAGATYWLTKTVSVEGEGFTSLYTANHLSGNTYRILLRKRF
jgi:opacity protein-like surface antigen